MGTRTPALILSFLFVAAFAGSGLAASCPTLLTSRIPARSSAAPSGREFADQVERSAGSEREAAIASQLLAGNLPDFLRRLKLVTLRRTLPDGRPLAVSICVAPDYLAVGSKDDFLRMPMALPTALKVASAFGFMLPTRKMVDAIYQQSAVHLEPQSLPASDEMRSTDYYLKHDGLVTGQRRRVRAPLDALTAGHKKDLVITSQFWSLPERVAIYGWHRLDGRPIQPLSLVHGARYADYSHGVRLVSLVAYVDGRPRSLVDLLEDPQLAPAISDEGAIPGFAGLVAGLGGGSPQMPAIARTAHRLAEMAGRIAARP